MDSAKRDAINWANIEELEDALSEMGTGSVSETSGRRSTELTETDMMALISAPSLAAAKLLSKIPDHENFCELKDFMITNVNAITSLLESQSEEKQMEPEPSDINYEQKFLFLTNEMSRLKNGKTLLLKPHIMTKLNTPFRAMGDHVLEMIQGDQYPEKWSVKQHHDLKKFRDFYKAFGDGMKIISSQQAVVDVFLFLDSLPFESINSATMLRYSENLYNFEIGQMSKNILNKDITRKDPFSHIEPTHELLHSAWLLNLFETVNFKIKLSHSVLYREKELSAPEFTESRRIQIKATKDGNSVVKVEIGNENNINSFFYLFVSQNITAIIIEGMVVVAGSENLDYLITLIDHNFILNFLHDTTKVSIEKEFIRHVQSYLTKPTKMRVSLAAGYETMCLMMADLKNVSAITPVLDSIIEMLNTHVSKTNELFKLCMRATAAECIKMSCINKSLIYAQVDEKAGLERYTQRTNRNHKVENTVIEDLRLLMRMKICTSYIRKYGRVPKFQEIPDELLQEMEIMAAKGNYSKELLNEPRNYENVRLGKNLESGQEVNLGSRIIDKACTKDAYDERGNSLKELIYYMQTPKPEDSITRFQISRELGNIGRKVRVFHRKHQSLKNMKEGMIVRLVEKEKELKTAARFFGVASFNLKITISSIMELVKRAMKLIPGQMMTMTEDERRDELYQLSNMLSEKDAYSIFLDYSGHNTSQRPDNNKFILEEICDLYGYYEGSEDRDMILDILYIFNNFDLIFENTYSDLVYYSSGQKGAIEGWFGPLWGIQSQLMMEDMLRKIGFKKYKGTTYSDDSCGVFIEPNLTASKLDAVIKKIQKYALSMGLIVKLSQTQVTNGRCSMLKNHYFKDTPIDTSYKRMMGITLNNPSMWADVNESVKLIDSGFTSACNRANDFRIQAILRNYRFMTVAKREVYAWISTRSYISPDPRFLANSKSNRILAITALKKNLAKNEIMPNTENYINNFFKFHEENVDALFYTSLLMYLPYTMFGYAMTSIPDAGLSGYSVSAIKRIIYCDSMANSTLQRKELFQGVQLSSRATSYISEAFPLTGGRFDTGTLLKDALKESLAKKIENENLLSIKERKESLNKDYFLAELLETFKDCFSARICSKFLECSIFNYFDEIFSKIDNSATFMYLLGKPRIYKMWNKAWMSNENLTYKNIPSLGENEYSYLSLVSARDFQEKYYTYGKKEIKIDLKFLKIEEIPLLGSLEHSDCYNVIRPIMKPGTVITKRGIQNAPPIKTNINITKFDRDLEIEGMFQDKLIFNAYELVRYVKWMIMDCEKYSKISHNEINSVIKICDLSLSTFTEVRFDDLTEFVVAPRGGRYFHRAQSSGFNPKTGDLTSNTVTNKFEVTGIDRLITMYGGLDNNVNVQYLITSLKVQLALLKPSMTELESLALKREIGAMCKDVSFSFKGIKPAEMIETFDAPKENLGNVLKIMNKAKLYQSYSSFIVNDENLSTKFLNHADTVPSQVIERENDFRSLFLYMDDQGILSPELIPDEELVKLVPTLRDYTNKQQFFHSFYSFYKGTNIIDNETPARAVIRSLLYNELFKTDSLGESWATALCEKGYSIEYRRVLLKLFVISTSLIYNIRDTERGDKIICIDPQRTLSHSFINYNRIKKGHAHFYIKDKRIMERILKAFPTLGYTRSEVEEAAEDVVRENQGKVFSQLRYNSFYKETMSQYIKKEFSDDKWSSVQYDTFDCRMTDICNPKTLNAAIKGFEMICAMNLKPRYISSPTMSDVFPSIFGCLSKLMDQGEISSKDEIADLFAGRGDSALAMDILGLGHVSVSRNDGYNLINRYPDMVEIKQGTDMTKPENYSTYLDRDVFLLDISHFSGETLKLKNMLKDLSEQKKRIILRLNSLARLLDDDIASIFEMTMTKMMIPNIESPGYLYLYINAASASTTPSSAKRANKFTDNIIYEKLTNEIIRTNTSALFDKIKMNTRDHTEEVISDDKLIEMLLSEEPEYLDMPARLQSLNTYSDVISKMAILIEDASNIEKETLRMMEESGKLLVSQPKLLVSHEINTGLNDAIEELTEKYLTFPDVSIEIRCNPFVAKTLQGGVILGFKSLKPEEIIFLSRIAMRDNYNLIGREIWNIMVRAIRESDILSSHEIVESILMHRHQRHQLYSVDKIYNMANLAVQSYKSKKINEGLLLISGIKRGNLKGLMENKSKEKRYNLVNYKLLINRITRLHRKTDIFIKEKYMTISDYKNVVESNTGCQTDKECEMLIATLGDYNSVEEYFDSLKGNSLFDAILIGIKDQSDECEEPDEEIGTALSAMLPTEQEFEGFIEEGDLDDEFYIEDELVN